ncbi:MAG: response regulator [bacterium]|nr:response regulator [bacterium]
MVKGKVLIVEDEEDVITILKEVLETKGYEVITIQDSHQAFDKIVSSLPDIILLDVMMPGISGYEICKRLKGDKITKDIPVVMLSARAQKDDVKKGFWSGADEYVTKPFDVFQLIDRLDRY